MPKKMTPRHLSADVTRAADRGPGAMDAMKFVFGQDRDRVVR
jgi:hypothetical protein